MKNQGSERELGEEEAGAGAGGRIAVPTEGVFRNASAFSVMGNRRLCGGISNLHLPSCFAHEFGKKEKHMVIILASIISALALIVLILLAVFRRKLYITRRSKSLDRQLIDVGHIKVTYGELLRATSGFSSQNLIGIGGFGSVYKGFNVCGEPVVAVKVFNLTDQGASESCMNECHALRHIRHRNLVKVITACSSVNFQGNEFMALVYEYMPNGNLDQWLHPVMRDGELQHFGYLNLIRRLNIAIDVASALEYLHFNCHTTIVHCDLKPTNVLLDDDMIGHVGDFGLARFLAEIPGEVSQYDQNSSHQVKGSLGYLPPEYGMGGTASIAGDVYSYGILLLEMFTGKRPTDEIFKDNLTLHQLAGIVFPDRVMDIIDPVLLSHEANKNIPQSSNAGTKLHQCLGAIVKIAISCSEESAKERMDIRDVVTQMQVIKDTVLRTRIYDNNI